MSQPSKPSHYAGSGLEPADVVKAMGDWPACCRSNIIKYVMRYRQKDGIADLEKASVYLQWLIEHERANDPR